MELTQGLTEPAFLSDIATVIAVILGLAIPVSHGLVMRMVDRLQSDRLGESFGRELSVRLLPGMLILLVVLAVALRFFSGNNELGSTWEFLSITILVYYCLSVLVFARFLTKVSDYSTKPTKKLDDYFSKARKAISP